MGSLISYWEAEVAYLVRTEDNRLAPSVSEPVGPGKGPQEQ
jgi:hypothetical protein